MRFIAAEHSVRRPSFCVSVRVSVLPSKTTCEIAVMHRSRHRRGFQMYSEQVAFRKMGLPRFWEQLGFPMVLLPITKLPASKKHDVSKNTDVLDSPLFHRFLG